LQYLDPFRQCRPSFRNTLCIAMDWSWPARILPRQTPPLAGHPMKRKRLLLILGCLATVLLAGYGTLRLMAPQHRITKENIAAIKEGMTEAEVQALLGVPAGDYSSKQTGGVFILGDRPWADSFFAGPDIVERDGGKFWVGDETSVWVRFDDVGQVVVVWPGRFIANGNESFLTKLRRWLGM
jgi:hypothetical protein